MFPIANPERISGLTVDVESPGPSSSTEAAPRNVGEFTTTRSPLVIASASKKRTSEFLEVALEECSPERLAKIRKASSLETDVGEAFAAAPPGAHLSNVSPVSATLQSPHEYPSAPGPSVRPAKQKTTQPRAVSIVASKRAAAPSKPRSVNVHAAVVNASKKESWERPRPPTEHQEARPSNAKSMADSTQESVHLFRSVSVFGPADRCIDHCSPRCRHCAGCLHVSVRQAS